MSFLDRFQGKISKMGKDGISDLMTSDKNPVSKLSQSEMRATEY